MQDEPVGVIVGEENVKDSDHFYNHNGEQTLHQAHSSVQTYDGVQLALNCSRIRDGGLGTLPGTQSRKGAGNEDAREDQMESEEGGGNEAVFDECPTPYHQLVMNIIIWNSRGVLRPNFQTHIRELVQNHEPVILVVMETRLGRDKAKKITDRLLFDGAIHTDTIGYEGGLWLLWNSDKVEVELLAKTEQEIHVEVKVLSSNLAWLFSAIYASPKSEERCILWENLTKVAELHNKAWVMAGDFNEPLVEEDKFGGKGVSISGSLLFKDCLDKCNLVETRLLGT